MDIKMMHEMIEKLTECAKYELDKGVENVDTKEMGEVADILKDLSEAMYYRTITEAMKESEYGEDYDEYGPMEEERRYYRGQPRSKTSGRYMSRGDGRRRGYEEPIYRMTPEMYRRMPMEWERDMDREGMGRMYYTDGGNTGGGSTGGTSGYSDGNYSGNREGGRDRREGRSGMMRRGYMEAKEMGKDKGEKMKELEDYMKELSSDVTEMISDASQEEKTMLKQKMQVLMSKIQ
jgi:hypothetical protein